MPNIPVYVDFSAVSTIPKVIHYCWFGGKPMPRAARRCIASWRKHCPDYEIREWNEKNYDVTRCAYMHEAYKAGKWAFVSDFARIDVLNKYGGVYLDTDVELLKPLDEFLKYPLFCGWEKGEGSPEKGKTVYGSTADEQMYCVVNFGLGVGGVAGHPVLHDLVKLYHELSFYQPDGSMNLVPCPVYQTRVMQRYGLDATQPTLQRNEHFAVFPPEYFSPKSYYTGLIEKTSNTVSIHHFSMSWKTKRELLEYWVYSRLARCMDQEKAYYWVRKQSARYDYWMGRIKKILRMK